MRKTPLRRQTSLPNRSQRLARSGPITPKRRSADEFARVYHSKERVAWVKALPCLVCGTTPSENAHTVTGGIGRKANYDTIVPACHAHHHEMHSGIRTFSAKYDIDLELASIATNQAWLAHCARV